MERFVVFVILFVILYGMGSHYFRTKSPKETVKTATIYQEHLQRHSPSRWREELARSETPEYLYDYILHVIEHGSNQFHFPGGMMEGGYVPEDVAPIVACYVMQLGGHRCPRPASKNAAMYFSSSCAGCHGNDGKGLHGTYPDLTRPVLLGIAKRREFLQEKLQTLSTQNLH